MPSALAVDWSAVQATYAATGGDAQSTARAHSIDPAAVRQRAKRGGWKAATVTALSRAGLEAVTRPAVPVTAAKPHEAVSRAVTDLVSRLGNRSRLNALRTADKGFAHSAKLDGESILVASPALASLGKLAQTAQAPGWQPAQSGSAGILGIHVTVRPTAGVVLDVEAEVTHLPDAAP